MLVSDLSLYYQSGHEWRIFFLHTPDTLISPCGGKCGKSLCMFVKSYETIFSGKSLQVVDLVPKNSLHLQWLPEPLINSTMPKEPPRATGPEGPCELRTAESKGEAVVDGGVLRGFLFFGKQNVTQA